jgi:hypothetical protein
MSQLVGYGIAGITRRFLVRPAAMLWPTMLPQVALFTSFHGVKTKGDESSRYSMSRYKYFWLIFAIIFVWTWFPSYLVRGLSGVSILCLLTRNKTIRFLASGHQFGGVGLMSFSFDYSMISAYQPVAVPAWATLNFCAGSLFWLWIIVPMCYYLNIFGTPKLYPQYKNEDGTDFGHLNSNYIYNSTGHRAFVRRVDALNPDARRDYT